MMDLSDLVENFNRGIAGTVVTHLQSASASAFWLAKFQSRSYTQSCVCTQLLQASRHGTREADSQKVAASSTRQVSSWCRTCESVAYADDSDEDESGGDLSIMGLGKAKSHRSADHSEQGPAHKRQKTIQKKDTSASSSSSSGALSADGITYIVKHTTKDHYSSDSHESIEQRKLTLQQANAVVEKQFREYATEDSLEICELHRSKATGCLKFHMCDQEGTVDVYKVEPELPVEEWELIETGASADGEGYDSSY